MPAPPRKSRKKLLSARKRKKTNSSDSSLDLDIPVPPPKIIKTNAKEVELTENEKQSSHTTGSASTITLLREETLTTSNIEKCLEEGRAGVPISKTIVEGKIKVEFKDIF
ncbi:uncharacterized protein LOC135265768 isoform X2 [Tribolium castaneum]|uniref:uncharacterized protein LOC135265768 isoform X2 n=1 Tax=Tribolium castaneum TaxID=7070 RepID=UPI0030FF0491